MLTHTESSSPPVDWDTLRVGDPEPPYDGARPCCALLSSERPLLCSRRTGHNGQHVAVANHYGVVAVWPMDGAR